MGNVGGDPARMSGGAQQIEHAATSLGGLAGSCARAARGASGAVGDPGLSSALNRLAAMTHGVLEDTGTQGRVAAQLASAAADDLDAATGGS